MIETKYEQGNPYQVVCYGRMSTDKQNVRSPDQQFASIKEKIALARLPWIIIKDYRDDGLSGRLVKTRPGLQAMLNDIAIGRVKADLILVDTWERFGRAEEIAEIRRRLRQQYGVLVVTADTGFANPTDPSGKALALIENIRATEDNRIKSHNVIRGKKDAARLKQVAGGRAPTGYLLDRQMVDACGKSRVKTTLKVDPEAAAMVRRAYEIALETGWRGARIAKKMNADPALPMRFKPFRQGTIDHWLSNETYIGTYVWGATQSDIIDDCHVTRPNPDPSQIVRVPDFCQPIIDKATFDTVQAQRQARSAARALAKSCRIQHAGEKIIKPLVAGLSLVNPLAGIARCGACNHALVLMKSGAGAKYGRCYKYYWCPNSAVSICPKRRNVPAAVLWEAVVSTIRTRLFAKPEPPAAVPAWFAEITAMVREELSKMQAQEPQREFELRQQLDQLKGQIHGWNMTLSNPSLQATVREHVQQSMADAIENCGRLESELAVIVSQPKQVGELLDPQEVLKRLHQLHEILSRDNINGINMELAKHIERIDCYPDGRIILRGTYLGLFAGAVSLLSVDSGVAPAAADQGCMALTKPRRLSPRKSSGFGGCDALAADESRIFLNPERFVGVPGKFFFEEKMVLPVAIAWPKANASAVLQFRLAHPDLTLVKIAEHFGKSRSAIAAALRIARVPDLKKPGQACLSKDPDTCPVDAVGEASAPQGASKESGYGLCGAVADCAVTSQGPHEGGSSNPIATLR